MGEYHAIVSCPAQNGKENKGQTEAKRKKRLI